MKPNYCFHRLLIILLLPTSIACSQDSMYNEPNNIQFGPNMLLLYPYSPESAPYLVDMQIEQDANGEYYLVSTIDFVGGTYVASPYSKDDFKGKFRMTMDNGSHISLAPEIEENPKSKESIDNETNVAVNWVREKTTYRQRLILPNKYDFEVSGMVSFTIEPRCTFEQVPFILTLKKGVLSVRPGGC